MGGASPERRLLPDDHRREGAHLAAAEALSAALAGRANIVVQRDNYYPDEYWLEISAVEANKAVAAAELRRYAGAERLVCFGDNNNDLPMFAVADASYATANANQAVRDAASAVIGASDDDAVARQITALHGARRVASA